MFLLYSILFLIVAVYFFLKKKFSYFEDRRIPHIKPSFPSGNIAGAGTKLHFFDIVKNFYKEIPGRPKIAGIYIFTTPIFVIIDLEIAKHVLIKDFNNFVNRGAYFNEEGDPLSANLLNIEDDKWRFLRNKLSPAFTSGKIKAMFEVIKSKGDDFAHAIERESKLGAIEVKEIAHRFTLDIISSVAFGLESDTLNGKNPELMHFSHEAFGTESASVAKMMFTVMFPRLSKFLNLRIFSKNLSDFFMNVVTENIKYREENGVKRSDFLNMLIELKNKGNIDGEFSSQTEKLTLTQCVAQAFIFFIGGSDTSSTTISFALAEISQNFEIQEKLRSEIFEKTKDAKGEINYENLQEMTYLNQVVNETLRKYPICFLHGRVASKDYQVPNTSVIIPKKASIWIPTIGYHTDETYWKNPEKFDPEHFSKEQIADRPAMAFIPFGEGPRNCIGMRFGFLNVKYGLATILKNFKVFPDVKLKYPLKSSLKRPQIEIEGGAWVRFEKI